MYSYCILSVVKTGLQSYCDTSCSRGGVNQMWILKISKYLLRVHTFQISLLSSFMTYHRVCNQIKTTGVASEAETANPSRAPVLGPGCQWGSCYSIFSFICMFCRSLFVLLYFCLGQCVVCSSSIYRFWYPFGIFKLFLYTSEKQKYQKRRKEVIITKTYWVLFLFFLH